MFDAYNIPVIVFEAFAVTITELILLYPRLFFFVEKIKEKLNKLFAYHNELKSEDEQN